MICRRPTVKAAALAASLVLASAVVPTSARASDLTATNHPTSIDYVITIPGLPNGIAAPSKGDGPQLVFSISPVGSVVPSTNADGTQGSPLSIDLKSYTASDGTSYLSNGFDTKNLVVGLKPLVATASTTDQLLGISFVGQGLAKGGVLDFTLNKPDPSLPDPKLTISPTSPIQNVSITQLPPLPPVKVTTTSVTSTPNSGILSRPPVPQPIPAPSTPEPMSLALWSVMTAAGLLRARAYHRRRRAG